MRVYLHGKAINLPPTKAIGKGGEADVFDIGNNLVAKIFKTPTHQDYAGNDTAKIVASHRILQHQKKLKAFPKNLPSKVVSPIDLITNKDGTIAGYTMRYLKGLEVILRYSEKNFRLAGVSDQDLVDIFKDLHHTTDQIHKANVVVGDYNDLNILIGGKEAYFIDADSFQYGNFYCKVYTERFVDPLLCDPNLTCPQLNRDYNWEADWYAYTTMLVQSLLYVNPYGGIYKPKDPVKRIPHNARIMKRTTIFDPEVQYPKPANHYSILSADLLDHLHKVYKEDYRSVFPISLLQDENWKHSSKPFPAKQIIVQTIRGNVKCSNIFSINEMILSACVQNNKLKYLYLDNNEFKRENGSVVISGDINPKMRFRIRDRETLIGEGNNLVCFNIGYKPEKIALDTFGNLPVFDTNEHHKYWLNDGRLLKNDQYGSKHIGDVLKNQTLFWVGSNFGFGFYRAGNISVGFVFDKDLRGGLNDSVKMPRIDGHLVDATCYFSNHLAWLFYSFRYEGQSRNKCVVIKDDGNILGEVETAEGDGSWLGNIRGKCSAGNFLLSATDDGIVRVEVNNSIPVVVKDFPDTEPFVNAGNHLHVSDKGLYVVGRREIKLLEIK